VSVPSSRKKIIAEVGAIAALIRRLVFTIENIAVELRNAAKKIRQPPRFGLPISVAAKA
jgi:hypothetical protein